MGYKIRYFCEQTNLDENVTNAVHVIKQTNILFTKITSYTEVRTFKSTSLEKILRASLSKVNSPIDLI